LPGPTWPAEIATAVGATLSGGRGAVVVVADGKDVDRVSAALQTQIGDAFVALTADVGPAERYRRFLRLVRGEVRAVVGTRAAAFAPVRNVGLCVLWDDGDDVHAEPRAPYPHARDVLTLQGASGRRRRADRRIRAER
jgi:primosomal protein N' (replication factor Y)